MKEEEGLVYIFTGEGKGKTSAAMWTAVRAWVWGKKVAVIAWYKEKRWPTAMQKVVDELEGLELELVGKGFYGLPTDHASEEEHRKAAQEGLKKAKKKLSEVEVLILDEVIVAVAEGLIRKEDLLELIEKRGKTHVVLTGRGAFEELIEVGDLVTEMGKIKHPFERGIKAVRGLDF